MRKVLLFTFAAVVLLARTSSAQVPATVHASWTPNPASDTVTQYSVVLDTAAPVVTLPAVCSATVCSQALTVPTFGLHTVTVRAQNLMFAADPTSLQSGPPLSVSFTLATAPVVVTGLKIGP
jgi:hypothetical protein